MPCVTLLLTGVPRYALLEDLSRALDLLFDTDEIGTFKLRSLPNHPRTKNRQVALDFRSGFDAMAAQEKLDSYTYEYNGQMYTLFAKINKVKEYNRANSFSPERSVHDQNLEWSSVEMLPDVTYRDIYTAHTKLDAQLELLRKQKLIVEAERELLREKRKLKREYGCMDGHDIETEATTSKHRRRSRGRRSGSRRRRSRSREGHVVRERRSRSTDRARPRPAWDEHLNTTTTRQLRSRSKERRSQSREAKESSITRDLRDLRSLIRNKRVQSNSQDRRSQSDERVLPSRERPHNPRSESQERNYRRSQSYERVHRERTVSRERVHANRRPMSRERDRERRSTSRQGHEYYLFPRERRYRDRRSTSRSRYIGRRSRSRELYVRRSRSRGRGSDSWDRTRGNDVTVLPRPSRGYRYLRSPDRPTPLAIMPNPDRSETPRVWAMDTRDDDKNSPSIINVTIQNTNVKNSPNVKAAVSKEHAKDSSTTKETGGNKTLDNSKNLKEKQEKKKLTQFNSKIRKQELLDVKIESVTQNVKLLVLLTLDEIIFEEKIKISGPNKILLEKTLEELVRERVEPLVRVRNDNNNSVALRKYKLLYPKENDVLLIRKMLEDISTKKEAPKVPCTTTNASDKTRSDATDQSTEEQNRKMHENTTGLNKDNEIQKTSCSGSNLTSKETNESIEKPKESDAIIPKKCSNNINAGHLQPSVTTESVPLTKESNRDMNESMPFIIDIDSPEKPVPKRPKFVLVIKRLMKDMKKAIVVNNLSQHIQVSDLQYVLRHMLSELMKGQAYLPNKDIHEKFRQLHPKEKDEQFVKDIIKDIKDGKYPGLTPSTDDCEDDVILIEKKYDVVTVEDSDDDDVTKSKPVNISGENESTLPMPKQPDSVKSSLEVTGSNLGTTNTCPETSELDTDKPTNVETFKASCSKDVTVVSNQGQIDNCGSKEPAPTNLNIFISGSIQPGSKEFRLAPGSSKLVKPNPNTSKILAVKPGSTNHSSTVVRPAPGTSKLVKPNPDTSKNLTVIPGSANSSSTVVRPAPGTSKLVKPNPDTSKNLTVIPGSANSSSTVVRAAPGTSKLVKPNPNTSKNLAINSGSANSCSTVVRSAPGTSKLVKPNPDTGKLLAVKPGAANPSSAVVSAAPATSKLVKSNPNTSKRQIVNTGSADLIPTVETPSSGTSKLATSNPDTSKCVSTNPVRTTAPATFSVLPVDPIATNLDPINLGPTMPSSRWDLVKSHSRTNVEIISGPSNSAQGNHHPSNRDEAELREIPRISRWDMVKPCSVNATENRTKPGLSGQVISLYDLGQGTLHPSNVGRVDPEPTNRLTNFGPVSSKFLPACLRPTELRPSLTTSKIRPNPGSATDAVKAISQTTRKANTDNTGIIASIDERKAEAENRETTNTSDENSLKVAAVTIATSLDEFATTTKDTTTMEETIEKMKAEIPFENSELELTASSLKPVFDHTSPETSLTANTDAKHSGNKTIEDHNRNSLKVTAITIMTSLNELAEIANKTNDVPEMEGPIKDIKEEMPFEIETEEDDSSLNLEHLTSLTEIENREKAEHPTQSKVRNEDNNNHSLKVTAITIMTSLTELTAIADKSIEGSRMELPIEDIKEEIPFEDSEQIESNSSHKFKEVLNEGEINAEEKSIPKETRGASYDQGDGSCGQQVGQGNRPEPTTSKNGKPSQEKTASDEEDETIESIVKYVQSLL